MSLSEKAERALHADNPTLALRDVAAALLREGQTHEQVLRSFEELLMSFRASGRDTDEDVVLEVMDFITGYCSPHMKL